MSLYVLLNMSRQLFTHRLFLRLLLLAGLAISLSVPARNETITLLTRSDVAEPAVTLPEKTQEWLRTHEKIRVGVWDEIPAPLSVDFQQGVFEGLSADYLKAIASTLNRPLEITHFTSRKSMEDALAGGEVDLLAYYNQNYNQKRHFSLSAPYLLIKPVLVYRKGDSVDRQRLFAGKSLAYVGDEDAEKIVRTDYPKANLSRLGTNTEAFVAVVYRNQDALWTNTATAAYYMRQGHNNVLGTLSASKEPDFNARFAATQNNSALTEAISLILSKIPLRSAVRMAETWGLDYDFVVKNHPLDLTPEETQWLNQNPSVPVFMADTHAPLSFIAEDERIDGLAISLLDIIARRTGIRFEYQHYNNLYQMKMRLNDDPRGLIAVADSTAGGNTQRDTNVAYARSYATTPWVLVTRKDYPDVKSLDALNGHSVAVYEGAWYLDKLRKAYPQIHFRESKFHIETSDWLSEKSVDGVIIPYFPAMYFLNNYFSDRFRVNTVVPIEPVRISMAANKNNPLLLSIINKALADIPPETIKAQIARWQRGTAPATLHSWSAYRDYLLRIGVIAGAILLLFLWRNAMLKRHLVQRKKYEEELEKAREAADRANESKSIFLSQMSHEIRTPLNALTGLLELEQRGKSSAHQREKNINVAWAASKSLLALVSDILDLAKIESGVFTVRKETVSLPDTVEGVMALFRTLADEKGIALISTLELHTPNILSDASMLRQIISNLVSNAIKFTDAGQVEVALYQSETVDNHSTFTLEICDTGPGLNAQQQRAIFEPFVQVETSRPAHTGTGLGLSICRQLADMLGGTLTVESEEGEGATFIFRFQAKACITGKMQPLAETEEILPAVQQFILIVDDHAPNRLLLTQQLESAGYETLAVENGEQALEAWDKRLPDVVITDCNMPGIDGFTLTRRLRESEASGGLGARPIFGLTAMAENEVLSRAKAAGMTRCLFKPIELNELLASLSGEIVKNDAATSSLPNIGTTLMKLARNNVEAFHDLAETIIEQNRDDLNRLQQHMSDRDAGGVRHAAHQLLGGARMVSNSSLATICRRIELNAEVDAWNSLTDDITECSRLILIQEHELRKAITQVASGE